MQESLCAEAASFDLHPGLLTACISEANNCIDLLSNREHSNEKLSKPEDFAVLRGICHCYHETVLNFRTVSECIKFSSLLMLLRSIIHPQLCIRIVVHTLFYQLFVYNLVFTTISSHCFVLPFC